jgi:hypothetical protein
VPVEGLRRPRDTPFEQLFVSVLESVRTRALLSYMCSIEHLIEDLIEDRLGPTVGGRLYNLIQQQTPLPQEST